MGKTDSAHDAGFIGGQLGEKNLLMLIMLVLLGLVGETDSRRMLLMVFLEARWEKRTTAETHHVGCFGELGETDSR